MGLFRKAPGPLGDCTFASISHRRYSLYLEPHEMLAIARLDAHGCDDTLSYVRATVIRVLEEPGLLTHLNQGVMSWHDFQLLEPVGPVHGHDA